MRILGNSLILIATALLVLQLGARWPAYNWDMIGYVAAAYHKDGLRGEALLLQTYADVRQQVDDATYAELLAGRYPEYRATVARDPVALEQQVPLYSIRVAYIESMRMLKRAGMTYAAASHVISVTFTLLGIGALALLCLQRGLPLLAVPIIVLGASHVVLAGLSTPDSMACFFALLATWLLLKGHHAGLAVAVLLPLFRTDYAILSCLLLLYRLFTGPRGLAATGLLTTLLLYGVLNATHDHYGWLTVFNFTFFQYVPFPADLTPSSQWRDYAGVYSNAAQNLLTHRHAIFYFLAAFLLLHQRRFPVRDDVFMLLLVIPVLFLGARLALFPLLQDRFFVYSSSLVLLWLMGQLSRPHPPARPLPG